MDKCNHDMLDNRRTLFFVRDAWNLWECRVCGATWGWRTKEDAERWSQERTAIPEHHQAT